MKILNGKKKTEALARPDAGSYLFGGEIYAIVGRIVVSYR